MFSPRFAGPPSAGRLVKSQTMSPSAVLHEISYQGQAAVRRFDNEWIWRHRPDAKYKASKRRSSRWDDRASNAQVALPTYQHLRLATVTGPELRQLRNDLGNAIGRPLSATDMAKLCGLPQDTGVDTIRRWEVSGPSGPVAQLLGILAMASENYPILENFNIFDRFNFDEKQRPALREAFRAKMRDEVRRRLG